MRVVVIGATGNAGTAVLRALSRREEITSVVGVARRMPARDQEPYAGAEWASIDIAAASEETEAVEQLSQVMRGADAVIHLAWLIQPNTERELLRRVNVEGTRRVAEAAAAAGVGQLVVASSVGSYGPCDDSALHDESWPVEGIAGSHYSVDKAAQERVLDEVGARHPELVLTRLRPALIFQPEAGAEIQRYFLGERLPVQLLGRVQPPIMPLPRGLQLQAVHGEDLGDAYAAAVVAKAPGAFNICADDVLGTRELARIVDHGRVLELPRGVFRAGLAAAYRAGLVPADGGWLDMACNVPLMDASRARRELGWTPRHSAEEAVRGVLEGMIDGRGADSVPLRPRGESGRGPALDEALAAGSARDDGGGLRAASSAEEIDRELLHLYLSDHLTGAQAGAQRIGRMAEDFIDTPLYPVLAELAADIGAERDLLADLLPALGMRRLRHRQAASSAAEVVGRLKLNGRITERSPMTLILETELMRSAIVGKLGAWQTLQANAADLGLEPGFFAGLAQDADRQLQQLDRVHAFARSRAFRTDRQTFPPDQALDQALDQGPGRAGRHTAQDETGDKTADGVQS